MADARPVVWVSQPLVDAALAPLRAHVELITTKEVTAWTPAQLAERLAAVDGAIVTLNERIGAAEVVGATRLRVSAGVGVGCSDRGSAALTSAGTTCTPAVSPALAPQPDSTRAAVAVTAPRVISARRRGRRVVVMLCSVWV